MFLAFDGSKTSTRSELGQQIRASLGGDGRKQMGFQKRAEAILAERRARRGAGGGPNNVGNRGNALPGGTTPAKKKGGGRKKKA